MTNCDMSFRNSIIIRTGIANFFPHDRLQTDFETHPAYTVATGSRVLETKGGRTSPNDVTCEKSIIIFMNAWSFSYNIFNS